MKTIIFSLTLVLGLMVSPIFAQKTNGFNANSNAGFQPVKITRANVPILPGWNSSILKTVSSYVGVQQAPVKICNAVKGLKENGEPAIYHKHVVRTKRNVSVK